MSTNTVVAYMNDCRQLASWAGANGLEPDAVDLKALRRYVAALSAGGQAPSTVARKLAAVRALFRVQTQLGRLDQNPADLVAAPKRPKTLPRVLKAEEVVLLLDRIPAVTPLEQRDRALLELAYSSGLRAEELVNLEVSSVDFDAETVRVEGKGDKTRLVPVGEHALAAVARYLERARPALRTDAGRGPGSPAGADVPFEDGPAPEHIGRAAAASHMDSRHPRTCPGARPGASAYAAALVRHAPARGRSRPALDSRASRACHYLNHSGLHSGRVRAPQSGLFPSSSSCMTVRRFEWIQT